MKNFSVPIPPPFVSSEVETRQRRARRPSTSLGTNGEGVPL
jgi:hypothetical protein